MVIQPDNLSQLILSEKNNIKINKNIFNIKNLKWNLKQANKMQTDAINMCFIQPAETTYTLPFL